MAAITAVNKVRSGGVAGFFCREEYEVIVDLRGPTRRSDISAGTPAKQAKQSQPGDPSEQAAQGAHSDQAAQSAQSADQAIDGSAPQDPNDPPAITPTIDLASAEPVAQTSLIQPPTLPGAGGGEISIDLSDPADGPSNHDDDPEAAASNETGATGEVFGGPRPETIDGSHAGFMALLQSRLDEMPEDESPLAARRSPQTPPKASGPPSVDDLSQPVVPAPGVAALDTPKPDGFLALEPEPEEPTGFWGELQDIEAELAGFMPVASAFIATIGPLSLTTPIVRRLRAQPGLESADVVVLTNRTEIVSEQQWKLVRSGNRLIDEAKDRGDRPTILVIDVPVELPNWVAPLQSHLRMAGVGLFRYAVPGEPDGEKLDQYRLASDVPYVLDLVSRSDAADLVDFIEKRHPIASVAGADVTPELLSALRRQVGLGR